MESRFQKILKGYTNDRQHIQTEKEREITRLEGNNIRFMKDFTGLDYNNKHTCKDKDELEHSYVNAVKNLQSEDRTKT